MKRLAEEQASGWARLYLKKSHPWNRRPPHESDVRGAAEIGAGTFWEIAACA